LIVTRCIARWYRGNRRSVKDADEVLRRAAGGLRLAPFLGENSSKNRQDYDNRGSGFDQETKEQRRSVAVGPLTQISEQARAKSKSKLIDGYDQTDNPREKSARKFLMDNQAWQ
jgi:hypothetical protein